MTPTLRPTLTALSAATLLVCLLCARVAYALQASQPALTDPIQAEVIANIRSQPVGSHSVADYNLPPGFLARMADRIIRSSFEERYRIVVPDAGSAPTTQPIPPAPRPIAPVSDPELDMPDETPLLIILGCVAAGLLAIGVWIVLRGRETTR